MKNIFLKNFLYYKKLGDQSLEQLNDNQVLWHYNAKAESVAAIVKKISIKMALSAMRISNKVGVQSGRNPNESFDNNQHSPAEILKMWEKEWSFLFEVLNKVPEENYDSTIVIHGEPRIFIEETIALFAAVTYSIGKIVYISKMLTASEGKTFFIPKNEFPKTSSEIRKEENPSEIQHNSSPVCFAQSDEVREEFKE